jgi:thioredoxin-related protein
MRGFLHSILLLLALVAGDALGADFTVPGWFKNSFLDLKEDAAEAGAHGRGLMVYVGQDGCPYCAALFRGNFGRKDIADFARARFDAVEINLWGDRPVADFDGQALTEKTFAAKHRVRYTPTILFFDAKGRQLLRIDGYYPPPQFMSALRYAAGEGAKGETFAAYLARTAPHDASAPVRPSAVFEPAPYDLSRGSAGKPLVVFFETKGCKECTELNRDVLSQPATLEQLKRFRAFQLDRASDTPLTAPDGRRITARAWADQLKVAYVPSVVFFDGGKEVMRIDAMLKAFHVQSVLDYVASGAYRTEPSFQRFIQARAERIRESGGKVDLWK